MNLQEEIQAYIASQPKAKQDDMNQLHQVILAMNPACKLWFLNGKNSENKVVANPNIGYGAYTITYADGKTKEFYRIGMCANTTGISIYIMGLDDKTFLPNTYGQSIGKASVTSYCIKFKALKDINLAVLKEAIQFGFNYH